MEIFFRRASSHRVPREPSRWPFVIHTECASLQRLPHLNKQEDSIHLAVLNPICASAIV